MTATSNIGRRLGSPWAVVLAGPVLATTYFWLVYLLAEATCDEDLELLGTTTLRITIVAATAGSVAVLAVYAWRARQLWRSPAADEASGAPGSVAEDRRENRRFMVITGLLLLAMFTLFVLFVAAPVIGSSLC